MRGWLAERGAEWGTGGGNWGRKRGGGWEGSAPGSGGGCGGGSTTACLHRCVGGGADIGGAGAGAATAIHADRQADLACQWLYVDQAADVGCLGGRRLTGRWRAQIEGRLGRMTCPPAGADSGGQYRIKRRLFSRLSLTDQHLWAGPEGDCNS